MRRLTARLSLAVATLAFMASASEAAPIHKIVSPLGIEAWLLEDHAVPIVAMNFAFDGGASQDPSGKPGVANMLAAMLDEGAGDMDSRNFQSKLDDLSIELNFEAGKDSFFGTVKTLAENETEAFHLTALAMQSPRFDAEPLERMRAQVMSGIKQSAKDPEQVAVNMMCATAFAGHPYGQPLDGTAASVTALSVADLQDYRSRVFARDNLKIAIVGAIDEATAGKMVDQMFGTLPMKARLVQVDDVDPKGGVVDVDMPNPQTVIRFGGPGVRRDDPDFMAAYVVNHILGGGSFSSRLYSEVREKRGLAYNISTSLAAMDHAGAVAGGTATRADRADETIALIRSEMTRLGQDGPTAEELAKAKSFLIGSYALRFDSSTKIARQLLGIQIDGLGVDYVNHRNDLVASVTLDDAKRAAKRLFANGTGLIVRVGPHES
jgi:zinc protease